MFSDQIEQMKRDYTDKYVVVDATRPELARFRDVVGRVKTVNMSGRALVEFDDYHLNIGWYDIHPDFLKVVDKPPPKATKPEAKKAAPKAVPAAKAPPGAPASGEPASAGGAGKQSVADILAAARAGKAGGAATAKTPTEPAPATAKPQAVAPAAPKADKSKMSVADMLAAARAGGAPGSAPAKTQAHKAPAAAKPPLGRELGAERQAKPAPPQETEEEAAPSAPSPKVSAPAAKSTERIDKSKMSIDDILAWCRQHDAK